jgi:hypothetical protein
MLRRIAVLLLVVSMGAAPQSRQKIGDGKRTTQNPAADQRGTQSSPLVVDARTIHSDKETAEEAKKDLEQKHINTWTIGLTLAIAICAFLQFCAIAGQVIVYIRQSNIMGEALKATQDQAKAAMGVAVPTLMLNEFTFVADGEKSLEEKLLRPTLMIGVKNYGQSPAIMKSFAVEFICGELPSVLRYPSILHFDSGTALENGESMLLEKTGVSPWKAFSKEEASEIARGGRKYLTVYGCVWYDDVFGSPTRKLTFCKWGADWQPDGSRVIWIDRDSPYMTGQNPN